MNRYVIAALAIVIPAVGAAVAFALYDGSNEASSAGLAPSVVQTTVTESVETASTTSSGSPPTTTLATTDPTQQAPPLEDGRHFGYIKSVEFGPSAATLTFDLAYLLTGDEANKEAARRGYPTPVDNDYFIVNDNPRLRTLALADDVELRLLDWTHCCETFFTGDLQRFAASFERKKYPAGNYKGKFSAYELTVRDGAVVAIDEHFFP
jgi:hypothetical protein